MLRCCLIILDGDLKSCLLTDQSTDLHVSNLFSIPQRVISNEMSVSIAIEEFCLSTNLGCEADNLFVLGVEESKSVGSKDIILGYVGEVKANTNLLWINYNSLHSNPRIDEDTKGILTKYVGILCQNYKKHHLINNRSTSIDRALKKVMLLSKEFNEGVGWDHFLDIEDRLGVIGTSIGIITLQQLPSFETITFIERAQKLLISMQLETGGWGTRGILDNNEPIVHSTAFAIWALSSSSSQQCKDSIQKAVSWLKKIQSSKTGVWGVDKFGSPALTTATTLVLIALSASKSEEKLIKSCVDWLISAQTPNGGWGEESFATNQDVEATPSHTGRVLYALSRSGVTINKSIMVKAREWLNNYHQHFSDWMDTAEESYSAASSRRLGFKHTGIAWATIGLITTDKEHFSDLSINNGYKIITNQNDLGVWYHRMTGSHLPIWTVLDMVLALSLFRDAELTLVSPTYYSHFQPLIDNLFISQGQRDNSGIQVDSTKYITDRLNEQAEKTTNLQVFAIFCIFLLMWGGLIFIMRIVGWEIFEQLAYLLSGLVTLISIIIAYIYLASTDNNLSLKRLRSKLIELNKQRFANRFALHAFIDSKKVPE